MTRLWWRLIAWGFRLLYDDLAWVYDPVSWVTSLGLWRCWTHTAVAFLPEQGHLLEVAFGPGHLLAHLAGAGYHVTGLDVSRGMLRLAARRLRKYGLDASLVRGRAEVLPFAPASFDAVVLTFPTPFVYDPTWLLHVRRVLRPGGRLIVVEEARCDRAGTAGRLLEWAYTVTGQRGTPPDLPKRLEEADFRARRERVEVEQTAVGLVIGNVQARAAPPRTFVRSDLAS
ncbi:MAG: class I SAM-dependent methyltransferase [Anaerolineae bacterium]|nr:class I SAM-dependent methyltransferase [Anaerolineae bacterium]